MRLGREMVWMITIFGLGLGLAMAAAQPAWAAQGKSVHLCDFEDIPMLKWSDTVYDIPTALKKPSYPSKDYDWNTGGYARIEPVEKREAYRAKNEALGSFMRGKYGALVRFTVPSEFRVLDGENDPASWESGMTLSTETATALTVTDWSAYKSLSLDVFNPSDKARDLFFRISDSGSTTFVRSARLDKGAATVQIPVKDLDDQRLDVADIRSITLFLDTAKMDKAPELYLDNLQLNTEMLAEYKSTGEEEEEEFEFEEEEDEELSEDALRKYGGRLKQATVKP